MIRYFLDWFQPSVMFRILGCMTVVGGMFLGMLLGCLDLLQTHHTNIWWYVGLTALTFAIPTPWRWLIKLVIPHPHL